MGYHHTWYILIALQHHTREVSVPCTFFPPTLASATQLCNVCFWRLCMHVKGDTCTDLFRGWSLFISLSLKFQASTYISTTDSYRGCYNFIRCDTYRVFQRKERWLLGLRPRPRWESLVMRSIAGWEGCAPPAHRRPSCWGRYMLPSWIWFIIYLRIINL